LSTGAIICVAGEAPEKWTEDDEACFRKQIDNFDTVRIMPSQIDSYQLQCLWLDLLSKGMTEIVIATAEFKESGKLEFTRQYCRFPLVAMN